MFPKSAELPGTNDFNPIKMLMTSDKLMKKLMLACALTCVAGTMFAGIAETTRDAKGGKKSAQQELAGRYANGNEVVKDRVLSEQWFLRADKNLSAKFGGDALAALRAKQAKEGGNPETATPEKVNLKPAKAESKVSKMFGNFLSSFQSGDAEAEADAVDERQSAPGQAPTVSEEIEETEDAEPEEAVVRVDDFQRILRAASQGNSLALRRFRTDENLANRLKAYARTPEGKRNPFVREVIIRLKKQ